MLVNVLAMAVPTFKFNGKCLILLLIKSDYLDGEKDSRPLNDKKRGKSLAFLHMV